VIYSIQNPDPGIQYYLTFFNEKTSIFFIFAFLFRLNIINILATFNSFMLKNEIDMKRFEYIMVLSYGSFDKN
jgi:hypothetical protein